MAGKKQRWKLASIQAFPPIFVFCGTKLFVNHGLGPEKKRKELIYLPFHLKVRGYLGRAY